VVRNQPLPSWKFQRKEKKDGTYRVRREQRGSDDGNCGIHDGITGNNLPVFVDAKKKGGKDGLGKQTVGFAAGRRRGRYKQKAWHLLMCIAKAQQGGGGESDDQAKVRIKRETNARPARAR